MASCWYVLSSKPHKENALCSQLQAFSVEVFFPRYLVKTGTLNVIKVKPFFPGYLFVRVDLDILGVTLFQHMPFSNGLVFNGEKPAMLPEVLVQAIRRRVEKINAFTNDLLIGVSKPAEGNSKNLSSGYELIFDTNLTGTERVMVLLHILEDIST